MCNLGIKGEFIVAFTSQINITPRLVASALVKACHCIFAWISLSSLPTLVEAPDDLNKAWLVAVLCTQPDNPKLFYSIWWCQDILTVTVKSWWIGTRRARDGDGGRESRNELSRTGLVLPPRPYRCAPLLNRSAASSLHRQGAMSRRRTAARRPGRQGDWIDLRR
jgi:hypothetical protein